MGEGAVPQIKDLQNYVNFRLEEAIVELNLALELLERGYSRNASQKAFMAWKAIVSALVAINLDRMPRNEEERGWYRKIGFLAPTTGLNRIARRLEELGYREAVGINSLALKLHRYAYNELYKDASDYYDRRDAIEDLVVLTRKLAQLIAELGREKEADGIMKKLGNITTQHT